MSEKVLFLALGEKLKVLTIDCEWEGQKRIIFENVTTRAVDQSVEVGEDDLGCFLNQRFKLLPKDSTEVVIVDENERTEVEKLLYQGLVKKHLSMGLFKIEEFDKSGEWVTPVDSVEHALRLFIYSYSEYDILTIYSEDKIELNGQWFIDSTSKEIAERRVKGCKSLNSNALDVRGVLVPFGNYDFFYDTVRKEWVDLKEKKA